MALVLLSVVACGDRPTAPPLPAMTLPGDEVLVPLSQAVDDSMGRVTSGLGTPPAAARLRSALQDLLSAFDQRDGTAAALARDEVEAAIEAYRPFSAPGDGPDLMVVELTLLRLEQLAGAS